LRLIPKQFVEFWIIVNEYIIIVLPKFIFICLEIDTIKTVSPTIEETLPAKVITDTIIVTNKIVEKDTLIDVRYYPVKKEFYIKAKPDTVTLFKTDTVITQIEKIEKKDNNSFLIIIAIVLIIVFIKIWRK